MTQQSLMQATVDSSAAEKHDSADADTADAEVDDVNELKKKLAQVTKTMRDTNARNEQLIHDLQKRAPKNTKLSQIHSIPSKQNRFSATEVRNAVPKVDDITIDQENLKQFRQQLRLNEVHNLAAAVVRTLENYDCKRQEKDDSSNLCNRLNKIFENMHFVMLCQCRNYMNWRQLYPPLATFSKTILHTMFANMSGEIKNYDLFEQFFFQAEKIFLHSRAKIENENEMESFLVYNKWCKSMAECKEESYYKNSDEKFFFVVVPYCEWQDFEAPACRSKWILKFPSKWKTIREGYRVSAVSVQKKQKARGNISQEKNVLHGSNSEQSMQDNNQHNMKATLRSEERSVESCIDSNIDRDHTLFLQVDSMHAASLIHLIEIGDKQMLCDFEKHYFLEYGKFGVVLQKSNWAWFELDLLRASQADIDFLIANKKLSTTCKHISYAEHLRIIIAKPSWLGQRFIPLFNPHEDMCLLNPPKHAVKEINLKIANNDLSRTKISLYLLQPLGFMQWPALSSNADATSRTKHLLFKQFAVGLHNDTNAASGTNTAKQSVRYIHVVPMIEVKYNGAKRFAVDMQTLGNVQKQLQKIADLKIQFLTMSSCLRALDTALVDSAGCIWMQLDLFNETQNSGGVPQSKKQKDIEHESSMRIKFQNLLIAAQYAREVSVLKII